MNGKIFFDNAEALAEFLKAFVGATATFEVKQNGLKFELTFLKGF